MDGDTVVVRRLPGVPLLRPSTSAATPTAAIRSKRFHLPRIVGRIALNFIFVAVIACVVLMLGPAVLGFHRYVILTGSMTGTYDRGSIVFDRPMPVSELKVGDPITYAPPPGFTSGAQTRITHRIWSIHRGVDGQRIFKTKGDANGHPDVWTFTLNQAMQDRVAFSVPEVGYLFLLLSLRDFRFVLIGVPALIIGLFLLRRLWREGGEEARRQKLAEQGWRALADRGSAAVLQPLDAPVADRTAPKVALRLKPVRARAFDPARLRISRGSGIDLSLPLRVGRLTSKLVVSTQAEARGSSIKRKQLAPGASIAPVRLLLTHKHTERGAPRTVLS